MLIQPLWIFIISILFNIALRILTPFLGKFRSGIDSLLFCAVLTGFLGGLRSGLFYGFLIAVTYYIFTSKRWDRAAFVIPMVALSGMLAGILHLPLIMLGLVVFIIYHTVSFLLYGLLLKNTGPGYAIFVILNFITTYGLLQIAETFIG